MTESDVLRLSINKLNELAKFYGLQTVGKQNVYWCRKCATHPHTRRQHYLKFSTRTPDLRTAILRAVPRVEDWLAGIEAEVAPAVRSPGQARVTLGMLEAHYLAAPTVRASKHSRGRNFADMVRVVEKVHGVEFKWRVADVAIIGRELAKEYQRRRLAEIEATAAGDLLAIEAGKRALNSTLAHAQSVFSRAALEDFHALRLPVGVREFADALPVKARKLEAPAALGPAVVQAIIEGRAKLRADDPGAWAVVTLMLWGGLRNVDCLHARRSWMVEEAAGWRVAMVPTADYTPKGSSGSVVLPAEIGAELLALPGGPVVETDPHLVPGRNPTDRVAACYRRANAWLKGCGLGKESSKRAYRLRKHFLRLVAEQQGRGAAVAAARHADQGQTLAAHYVGVEQMAAPVRVG